jgi:hypothetical protein
MSLEATISNIDPPSSYAMSWILLTGNLSVKDRQVKCGNRRVAAGLELCHRTTGIQHRTLDNSKRSNEKADDDGMMRR